ncbi:MAG: glycosyltransferase family 2 protein [Bacteroidaceae bacterium]|nr:glycosyltransferase family 2 protein [Bacteroidaceae bacterium]
MQLSVIIVNYNVKHYIAQCIDSVLASTIGMDAEIIVVDNHSSDGSVAYLRQHYPQVQVMASNHNLGFSRANNIGVKSAKGEYILFLNPDTIVKKETISDCLRFMERTADCAALGVCQRHADGGRAMESRRGLPTPMTSFYKVTGLCNRFPSSKRMGRYYMSFLPWDESAKIDVISGAFFFVRKDNFIKAGMFDEDYFMYGEDIDLSYCIQKSGGNNYYLPTDIIHYKGESTQKSSFRYVHVFYQAMLIFMSKHMGGMNILLRLPIQCVIYLKAMAALCSITAYRVKRLLGFTTIATENSSYVFVIDRKNFDACSRLVNDNALDAEYITFDTADALNTLCRLEHSAYVRNNSNVHIVYDTSVFSFSQIISKFTDAPDKKIFLGTYCPRKNVIITKDECFC